MIYSVLKKVITELNTVLKRGEPDTADRVILSALVDQSGDIAFSGENKIVCMLTSIEQERGNLNNLPSGPMVKNPPIYLNLNLLFAAYFPGNYEESLKFIFLVITFFQAKYVFTHENTPGLPPEVEKIFIEINNLDQQAQHQLWSAIGAKMTPSISMKLRIISNTLDQLPGPVQTIKGLDTTTAPRKN